MGRRGVLIWDDAALGRLFGGDLPMHHRMLTLFIRDAFAQVAAIERAAAAGETGAAADLAHMLKTSARMVGAMRMGQLCEEIESCGLGNDAQACRAMASGLDAAFTKVRRRVGPRAGAAALAQGSTAPDGLAAAVL